ncbi:MAG: cytochrome-c oxidase, cbb3-type subunit III [Pseudomonadota bacterium]
MADINPNQAQDTGHEWDGIRELKNSPPRWWSIAFVLSFVWVAAYALIYPMIPLVNDYTRGLTGWTALGEYKEAVAKYDAIRAPYIEKLNAMSAQEILKNPEMLNFAKSYTKALFGDKCASCHGANGQGTPGLFPTLNDDDWLYGGTVDDIITTVTDGRQSIMPAHAGTVSEADINTLADFVIALPKGQADQAGWDAYNNAGCSGCHGEDGKGNKYVGAANLTDNIWRFGGSREAVLRTIKHGVNQDGVENTRNAVMPAFGGKLSPNDIKLLAVTVWDLGGGQTE